METPSPGFEVEDHPDRRRTYEDVMMPRVKVSRHLRRRRESAVLVGFNRSASCIYLRGDGAKRLWLKSLAVSPRPWPILSMNSLDGIWFLQFPDERCLPNYKKSLAKAKSLQYMSGWKAVAACFVEP